METLRQQTVRWWPAAFAAARYVTYNALLTYHGWHIAMKDEWGKLSDWDQINVGCSVGLSVLVALGAIMNGSWHRSKEGK
jgi:hypothetical protein